MREIEFKQWLIDSSKYTIRSLNDKMSHCRRIEKVLNKDLDALFRNSKLEDVTALLSEKTSGNDFSSYNRSHLSRALSLYYEFFEKNLKQRPSSSKR